MLMLPLLALGELLFDRFDALVDGLLEGLAAHFGHEVVARHAELDRRHFVAVIVKTFSKLSPRWSAVRTRME